MRVEAGAWSLLPGSGGLVTALSPALEARGGLWVGWPGLIGESADEIRPLLESFAERQGYGLVPVSLTRAEHELFYLGFANEVLWPLFHDLQSRCTFVPEYWQAFLDVNRKFAAASGAVARAGDMVWVHDYLLLGVGRFARELLPAARLGFFLHIPFPPPDIFAKLPWRTEVLRALLAYDLVGFQTVRDRRNFVACLRALLPEAAVRGRGNAQRVIFQGRQTRSATFPIGIDARGFADLAQSPDVAARAQGLQAAMRVEHLLLGVDRLDYTKGIRSSSRRCAVCCVPVPTCTGGLRSSRSWCRAGARSPSTCTRRPKSSASSARSTASSASRAGLRSVTFTVQSTVEELVAYYRAASVCLATPLKDGMNLVAKEYCACQTERRGVLVLSEFAGSAVQLGDGALLVNPYDILGVAAAIARACEMPTEERKRRMARLQRNVLTEDVHRWVDDFLGHAQAD